MCRRFTSCMLVFGLAVATGGSLAGRCQADDLERELQKNAPAVIEYLSGKGYKNVGVLKFRVKKGNEPISDSVGTLNMALADRLEVALVLANPNDPARQLGIVRRASAVAGGIAGASHANAEGRRKLFSGEYRLAWGDAKVTPDAFVTGVVKVSDDLKEFTVGILAFDQSGEELEKAVPVFTATTNAFALSEVGESFLVRGAFDKAAPQMTKAKVIETAALVKGESQTFPLADEKSPVVLEILYDDVPVSLEIKGGKAQVAEPQEGQKIAFVLKRKGKTTDRMGVVLKVNGENTLFREQMRDIDCKKWILDPGEGPITITGYQQEAGVAEKFQVLSAAESKQSEVRYGADVGMITVTVFAELKPGAQPSDLPPEELSPDDAEDLAALTRGVFPKHSPKNLAALKHQLREATRGDSHTRGLIVQGQKTGNKIRTVQFKADPTPVMSAAITYYQAGEKP